MIWDLRIRKLEKFQQSNLNVLMARGNPDAFIAQALRFVFTGKTSLCARTVKGKVCVNPLVPVLVKSSIFVKTVHQLLLAAPMASENTDVLSALDQSFVEKSVAGKAR